MRRPWVLFTVLSTGVALPTLDQFAVNVAFPSIGRALDGSVGTLSWALNGYSIVFAALLVPAGRIADRRGRKAAFLLASCLLLALKTARA
jgi:MFS family permease